MSRSVRAALVAAVTTLVAVPLASVPAVAADDPDLVRPRTVVGSPERTPASTAEGTARTPAPSRGTARPASTSPLTLTIDTLTPGSIPARGRVRVAGTVTNTDSVLWQTVNVYPFISDEPMRNRGQLAEAVTVEESASVGQRIVEPGNFATIDALEPGESTPFTLTVDVDHLAADTAGVYWFGVHALGQRADEGRDTSADGRARTFLPRVPGRREGQAPVAVGIPLRGNLEYADDGSLDDLDRWITTLAVGGRLRSLVELGGSAGDRAVTWVVDPALLDAVRQLAAGNPARSLEPNLDEGEDDGEPVAPSPGQGESTEPAGETSSESPSETPSDDATEEPVEPPEEDPVEQELPEDLDALTREAAEAAREWLARLEVALDDRDEVLALPYGDLDVSAAARHDRGADDGDPGAYARAAGRSALPLPGLDVTGTPAVAAPSGYLSPQALGMLGEDVVTLVGDHVLDDAPAVASVEGRRLVLVSDDVVDGGPGPGDPRGTIALRQRIVAEAAVRFLTADQPPLVVLLPPSWTPSGGASFFAGMDLDWLDLTSVTAAAAGATAQPRTADELRYPDRQAAFELDAANFVAVDALREAGETLQSLLTLNNLVGGTVTDQSLAMLSYAARSRPDSTRASADRSRRWIEERLGQVRVSAPQAVTLSSINGSFPASVRNGLDQPVTVSLAARGSDRDELEIAPVGQLALTAGGRESILLDARTETPGVHEVTIVVTDKTGRPLGGSDQMSVRSARVSNVIWLFLAAGSCLLFGTIAFRLVRRVRAARR